MTEKDTKYGAPCQRCYIKRTFMKWSGAVTFLKDAKVPKWRKLFVFGAIAYTIWPFDFIFDAIPFLGWLDDIGVLSVAAAVVWRDVQRHLKASSDDAGAVDR